MRVALLGIVLLIGCGGGGGSAKPDAGPPVTVKVMTRNLHLGADLLPVVSVTAIDDIPIQVAALWKTMQASDLPGRAKLLADEIAAAKPDLVGLQEAVVFYKQVPGDFSFAAPKTNATTVEIDIVQLLLAELAARGAEYQTAAALSNSDVELPAADELAPFDVRMTDRIVILARKGLSITSTQGVQYMSHLPFTIPVGVMAGAPVDLIRGVVRVEAVIDGAPFTFATTQLEVSGGPGDILRQYQENQARNLITVLEPIKGPLVLVGDFNSAAGPPATMTYGTIAAKFTDAHATLNPAGAPFTCCTELAAPTLTHQQRVDFVFHRGGITADSVEVVGTDQTKRTPAGLWPSRHAGVVATLRIPR